MTTYLFGFPDAWDVNTIERALAGQIGANWHNLPAPLTSAEPTGIIREFAWYVVISENTWQTIRNQINGRVANTDLIRIRELTNENLNFIGFDQGEIDIITNAAERLMPPADSDGDGSGSEDGNSSGDEGGNGSGDEDGNGSGDGEPPAKRARRRFGDASDDPNDSDYVPDDDDGSDDDD